MTARPPLSVVIPVREGIAELDSVLKGLLPQASATSTEVIVVGPAGGPVPAGVRLVELDDPNFYELRRVGIREATGEIVAIGEDHAEPRPDWCAAVIRAHGEHPSAAAIIGCLENVSTETLTGRANFLAFAACVGAPMRGARPRRPPPVSALSFKREALGDGHGPLGEFEAVITPRLFAQGAMEVDERVVVDHRQDHGLLWSIANGFHGARASYGYLRPGLAWRERLQQARWGLRNWPPRILREARERPEATSTELAIVVAIGAAMGAGSAAGSLLGPGRSPALVA